MQSQPSFSTRRPLAFSIKLCHCHPPSAVVGNDANAGCAFLIIMPMPRAQVGPICEFQKDGLKRTGGQSYEVSSYGSSNNTRFPSLRSVSAWKRSDVMKTASCVSDSAFDSSGVETGFNLLLSNIQSDQVFSTILPFAFMLTRNV